MNTDDRDRDTEAARPVSEEINRPIHPALIGALGAALIRLTDEQIGIGVEQLRQLATHPDQPPEVRSFFRIWVRILLAEHERRKRLLDRLDPENDDH